MGREGNAREAGKLNIYAFRANSDYASRKSELEVDTVRAAAAQREMVRGVWFNPAPSWGLQQLVGLGSRPQGAAKLLVSWFVLVDGGIRNTSHKDLLFDGVTLGANF